MTALHFINTGLKELSIFLFIFNNAIVSMFSAYSQISITSSPLNKPLKPFPSAPIVIIIIIIICEFFSPALADVLPLES